MSRDRPTVLPAVVPADRKPFIVGAAPSSGADIERLKRMSGPGILAGVVAANLSGLAGAKPPSPQFLRPGYEGAIRENVNDFFRGRGWRPKSRRSGATHKERLKMRRRAAG